MKNRYIIRAFVALLLSASMLIPLAACDSGDNTDTASNHTSTATATTTAVNYKKAQEITTDFSNFDNSVYSDFKSVQNVSLSNIGDNVYTITKAGSYELSGDYKGSISIKASENDKVVLILNNASITSEKANAIDVTSADKVMIYTAKDSKNTVNVTGAADDSEDAERAAIYSTSALTLSGEGELTVSTTYNNGIQSKKNIKIISGNIDITSQNNGLKAKNYVAVKNGSVTIDAQGNGIKTTSDSDADKGYFYMENGSLKIEAEEDGIDAATYVSVTGGDLDIITTGDVESGGSGNGGFGGRGQFGGNGFNRGDNPFNGQNESGTDNQFGGFGGRGQFGGDGRFGGRNFDNSENDGSMPAPPDLPNGENDGSMPAPPDLPNGENDGSMPTPPDLPNGENDGSTPAPPDFQDGNSTLEQNGQNQSTADDTDDVNSKGIKAGIDIYIKGGNITVSSTDHCIYSKKTLTIDGGKLSLTSTNNNKGIKALEDLTVNNGDIDILKSYEGIESKTNITINGGTINVNSSDDPINAIGDLTVNGGTVHVKGNGDGIDSNASIYFNGGDIIVDGAPTNGETAIDYGSEKRGVAQTNGGTVFATGYSGMVESFDSSSKQYSIQYGFNKNYDSGTKISVADSNGKELYSYTSQNAFNCIVYSSAELTEGEAYTITAGADSYTVTLDSICTSNMSKRGMR